MGMSDSITDLDQLRERAETLGARAFTAEKQLADLRAKYERLERDRNALLALIREREPTVSSAIARLCRKHLAPAIAATVEPEDGGA
jgi:DNA repair exonuclease SbcCD ATPase subunit